MCVVGKGFTLACVCVSVCVRPSIFPCWPSRACWHSLIVSPSQRNRRWTGVISNGLNNLFVPFIPVTVAQNTLAGCRKSLEVSGGKQSCDRYQRAPCTAKCWAQHSADHFFIPCTRLRCSKLTTQHDWRLSFKDGGSPPNVWQFHILVLLETDCNAASASIWMPNFCLHSEKCVCAFFQNKEQLTWPEKCETSHLTSEVWQLLQW